MGLPRCTLAVGLIDGRVIDWTLHGTTTQLCTVFSWQLAGRVATTLGYGAQHYRADCESLFHTSLGEFSGNRQSVALMVEDSNTNGIEALT